MEELMNEIHRHLVKLDDPNKIERKKNLQAISRILSEKYPLVKNPNLTIGNWSNDIKSKFIIN